ncbi:uncharacterized protein LOC121382909 [Gigantopelta aegis]|uniref:uncharacterized protein LOC121382909 n=1 Tax=Gigantopelta aegis TaxID=1735272 RepID=UPI001B88D432|nr:uncharacterized protein LOC121382909 [Gigantopelta aegis]
MLFVCVKESFDNNSPISLSRPLARDDWKKVWKQKRDAFTKKRREIAMCKRGSATKTIKKGPLYDQLTFLVDHGLGGGPSCQHLCQGQFHQPPLKRLLLSQA